jgi:hypothetical protein
MTAASKQHTRKYTRDRYCSITAEQTFTILLRDLKTPTCFTAHASASTESYVRKRVCVHPLERMLDWSAVDEMVGSAHWMLPETGNGMVRSLLSKLASGRHWCVSTENV